MPVARGWGPGLLGCARRTRDVIRTGVYRRDRYAEAVRLHVSMAELLGNPEQFATALHIHLHMWPGGHDFGYWNAHWNNYLGFYARALAAWR